MPKRKKRPPLWVKSDHSCNRRGERFTGTLPAIITSKRSVPASRFKITSAFDGEIDYPSGGYGDRARFKPDLPAPHHISDPIEREKYERKLRKMERVARRKISALEAGLWAWTRPPGIPRVETGSCERVPYWRDWEPTNIVITPLQPGDCAHIHQVRLKVPGTSTAYGTGLDVEGRAQMNNRFADWIDNRG